MVHAARAWANRPLFVCLSLAGAVILGLLCAGSVPAKAQEAAGERQYRNACADCHGPKGEKKAFGRSRPIAGMSEEEVQEALRTRRAIQKPKTMNERVKAALSDEEIDTLSSYVATFGDH